MFSRFVTLFPVVALAAVAAAAPNELDARNSKCSTGDEYCCNQAFANPVTFGGVLGNVLNVVVTGGSVGLTCTPIILIGGFTGTCTTQTACCSNVETNGVVNVVCDPIVV